MAVRVKGLVRRANRIPKLQVVCAGTLSLAATQQSIATNLVLQDYRLVSATAAVIFLLRCSVGVFR